MIRYSRVIRQQNLPLDIPLTVAQEGLLVCKDLLPRPHSVLKHRYVGLFFPLLLSRLWRLVRLQVELDVLKRVSHKHIIALVGAGLREEKPHRFLALEVR